MSRAAGATAALALLGKYYSAFLVASFVLAAILHPQRRQYFGSLAPWVSTAAGLLVLAPHLYWSAANGAPPFRYALEGHTGEALSQSIAQSLSFLLGVAAAMVLPAIAWVMIAGTRLRRLPADFRAMDSGLHLLFLVAVGTLIFPILTVVALRSNLPPLWAFQGLFLFIVVIVCGSGFAIERFYTVNLAVVVLGMDRRSRGRRSGPRDLSQYAPVY